MELECYLGSRNVATLPSSSVPAIQILRVVCHTTKFISTCYSDSKGTTATLLSSPWVPVILILRVQLATQHYSPVPVFVFKVVSNIGEN